MTKRATAAVFREMGTPISIEQIEVESPRRDEVMLRVVACGVCHSDLSVTNGTIPMPPPIVLGHEAAGFIEEVGEGVTDLEPGTPVVVSWIPMCGKCRYCQIGRPALCDRQAKAVLSLPDGTSRLMDLDGHSLHMFSGVAVMAEYTTVHKDNVIAVDADLPLDRVALVGCAVMTGVGAVFNTAKVEAGSSVAVFGAGGIGLNAIQGAALAGAEQIIAIDLADLKLTFARDFGATHVINPRKDGEVVKMIRGMTDGGADYAFECIGVPEVIAQAYDCVRKGGTAVVVGVSKVSDEVSLRAFGIPFQEKVLVGSMYGSARPRIDFPRLLSLYRQGRLKLDELVTATYAIQDVNRAFADMQAGTNARGVILF